uniref:Uncharacterized protein n=1 Tax=Anguilla anguilla TaxID=7936 RepID=A0A0E9XLL4_ANGAN
MADRMSSFCKWALRCISASSLLVFTAGSLEITPVPEQGASSNTRSNPPITLGNCLPS